MITCGTDDNRCGTWSWSVSPGLGRCHGTPCRPYQSHCSAWTTPLRGNATPGDREKRNTKAVNWDQSPQGKGGGGSSTNPNAFPISPVEEPGGFRVEPRRFGVPPGALAQAGDADWDQSPQGKREPAMRSSRIRAPITISRWKNRKVQPHDPSAASGSPVARTACPR